MNAANDTSVIGVKNGKCATNEITIIDNDFTHLPATQSFEEEVIGAQQSNVSAVSLPTASNAQEEETMRNITVPKVRDRIKFKDPDTGKFTDCIVVSRAGKVGKTGSGSFKSWFNVKDTETQAMKSVDFEVVTDWEKVENQETIFSVEASHSVASAQLEELQKWKDYKVYEEVEDEGQEVISTRWVITEKHDKENTQIKARLVARGFEEDATNIKTDSPTIHKENFRLLCILAMNNGWKVNTLDIKAAFLQGADIDRAVHLLPPPEANTAKLWKLKRSVYGLVDGPRMWYEKLHAELTKIGAVRSKYDYALFYWRHENQFQGILCCHVDDCFYAGSFMFHNTVIAHIRNTFSLSRETTSSFTFLGLQVNQFPDRICISQDQFIDSLSLMTLENIQHDKILDLDQKRQFKSLVGQLQWAAKQTRPDVAFSGCQLSTKVNQATHSDIKKANKQLKLLQQKKIHIQIFSTGSMKSASLVLFSDASHGNLPGGSSQGGFIIFLQGQSRASPLIWRSHKLKRVVKSAMAAETMALLEGAEYAMLMKVLIKEITRVDVPITCITDNKSLCEAVKGTSVIEDKRLYIDICSLRQMLVNGEICVTLTSSKEQLADCLTKGTASSDNLLRVLIEGKLYAGD